MRLTITLQALERGTALPINYQYPLSSWIYQVLEQGDRELADFLHEEGYSGNSHRRFKFYSFSELRAPGARVQGNRLALTRPEARFSIGFLANRAAQTMIMGLFRQAEPFWLGDSQYGGRFTVSAVEMQMLPPLREKADFFTTSPVVVSIGDPNPDGTPGRKYLSPFDEGFEAQFLGNLQQKYSIARQHGLLNEAEPEPEASYTLLSHSAKEKRIDLLRGQPGYTRVRGYKFRFRLHAPEPMLRLAMLAGVGEKNAMGFGAVEEKPIQ
ncbi:MAG: CRISPR-associated endoribonuclease Cas6 [Lewinellaceae bacterium]|nr:CRISPR-associated endoribonuclease Cas6 [Lewinellaceae bacterium]